MSEENNEELSNGKNSDNPVFEKIKSGGKRKSDKIAPLNGEIACHNRWLYEDLAFFFIFSAVHLDFTLSVIVKPQWLPLIFVVFQACFLVCLILKKGCKKSCEFAGNFLSRIALAGDKSGCVDESSETVPFDKEGEQPDFGEKLENLKTRRSQNLFIVIVVNIIFIDVEFFYGMSTWSAPICILILEGFIIFVLGKQLGMPAISELISGLLGELAEKGQSKLSEKEKN